MAVTELSRKATVACPFCATLNRVDLGRLPDRPKCGHCGRPILVDRPVAVTDATVEAVLAGTTVPVVMDCYADWCGPCKIMAPVLDDLAHERAGEVLVTKLDTDRNPAIARRFDVRAIPTLIVFRQGREVARHTGVLARRGCSAPVRPLRPPRDVHCPAAWPACPRAAKGKGCLPNGPQGGARGLCGLADGPR